MSLATDTAIEVVARTVAQAPTFRDQCDMATELVRQSARSLCRLAGADVAQGVVAVELSSLARQSRRATGGARRRM